MGHVTRAGATFGCEGFGMFRGCGEDKSIRACPW
jgi:hypothetical protein